jgi:hypothetical protein
MGNGILEGNEMEKGLGLEFGLKERILQWG